MTYHEVIVQPRAEREIRNTHDFLATTAPASAERWLNGILSLEEMPERCPFASEAPHFMRPIRQLLYEDHRIIFWVDGRHVRVLTVRHQRQRPLRRKRPN